MDYQDEWFADIPELHRSSKRPSLTTANAFYWAIAVAFALLQAGLGVIYWLLSAVWDVDPVGYVTAVQVLMYMGAMLLPVGAYILTRPEERWAFRLGGARVGQMVMAVVAAGLGFFAANFLTTLWMILLESIGLRAAQSADVFSGNLALDIAMISLLPAVCEELLFRGLILGAYERRGTWRGIWISAALFAGLHGSVAGLPAHLMLGLALGYVAAVTHSIWPCMALHGVYNAITVIIAHGAADGAASGLPLIEQVGGMPGVAMAAVMAAVSIALFFLALRALDRMRVRAGEPFGDCEAVDQARMRRGDIVLLASAIATVVWFYVQDILTMI